VASAPVDFHKRQLDFTFDPTAPQPRPAWRQGSALLVYLTHALLASWLTFVACGTCSGHALSMSVLLQAMKENISYEVFVSQHGNVRASPSLRATRHRT